MLSRNKAIRVRIRVNLLNLKHNTNVKVEKLIINNSYVNNSFSLHSKSNMTIEIVQRKLFTIYGRIFLKIFGPVPCSFLFCALIRPSNSNKTSLFNFTVFCCTFRWSLNTQYNILRYCTFCLYDMVVSSLIHLKKLTQMFETFIKTW